VQQSESEVADLRALCFAESLPIHPADAQSEVVVRLESGRIGIAVEFRLAADARHFCVKPLVPEAGTAPLAATNVWSEIVQDLHRRAPLGDDD